MHVPSLPRGSDDVADFLHGAEHPAEAADRGGCVDGRDFGNGRSAAKNRNLDMMPLDLAKKRGKMGLGVRH